MYASLWWSWIKQGVYFLFVVNLYKLGSILKKILDFIPPNACICGAYMCVYVCMNLSVKICIWVFACVRIHVSANICFLMIRVFFASSRAQYTNVNNNMNIPALTSRCSVLPSTELRWYEFAVPLYVSQLCIYILVCIIISKKWCIIISYKYIVLVSVCAILVAPKNKYSAPPFNSIKS